MFETTTFTSVRSVVRVRGIFLSEDPEQTNLVVSDVTGVKNVFYMYQSGNTKVAETLLVDWCFVKRKFTEGWTKDGNMGVKIEVFRMMLYLSFPVTMFWISNQAEYFEEYIVKRKREIFPPDERHHRKELEDFKERMRSRKEQRILKEMAEEN